MYHLYKLLCDKRKWLNQLNYQWRAGHGGVHIQMASYHEQSSKHARHAKDTNRKLTEKGATRGCEARPQVYGYIDIISLSG